MSVERAPRSTPRAWQLIPLTALAVSHPIADILVRGPEFFVAHRFDAAALVWLGVWLFVALPAGVWLVAAVTQRLSRPIGRTVTIGLFVILTALIVVQVLKQLGLSEPWVVLLLGTALGSVAAFAYARARPFRWFVSALAPAPLVAALLFFASPPAISVMRGPQAPVSTGPVDASTPVVMVVFDQLPLVSLLDGQGNIDAARYPSFAALAGDATWYRNTTTVSYQTAWAVPALLTGRYPQPTRLPSALHHRDSLFSLLAPSHRLHVVEPMTALCPMELCPPDEDPGTAPRWATILSDLVIVYGHMILPEEMTATLPPVTHEWAGFGRNFWQARWVAERDDDRRQAVVDWIEEIEADDAATLHFLHVLLPHEPYIYLPTGQVTGMSGLMPGLERRRWSSDPYLVALNYQQHLLQVQFVDTLLGRLVNRLKAVGLYDRAVIAVVADHGASFRPEEPFKQPNDVTRAEIATVPFLLKTPGRPGGMVVDEPLETVDVLPTIAQALGVGVPWPIDGHAAQASGASRDSTRRMYTNRGTRHFTFTAEEHDGELRAAERYKFELIDADPTRVDRRGDPARHLIGRPLDTLAVTGDPTYTVSLDAASLFEAIETDGAFVPAYVSGRVQALDESPVAGAALAVAVNGVIRATTRVTELPIVGREGFWAALVPPDAYRAGPNDMTVLHLASSHAGREIRPTRLIHQPGEPPDLMDPSLQAAMHITATGFHGLEWHENEAFRWTSGEASLVVPLYHQNPPDAVQVNVLMGGHPSRTLELRANDCVLFRDPVPEGVWSVELPLADCGALGDSLTISFTSDTFVPDSEDSRELGIGIQSVRLLSK